MSWLHNIFGQKKNLENTGLVSSKFQISNIEFAIPEPTNSLLFVTNEDISKLSHAGQISLTISFNSSEASSKIDYGNNLFAEPSLIWKKLPIKKNSNLEQQKLYYPSYSKLTTENRYQYLTWLQDVTQPTNLSYVFLYYYGLERHLLVGNYEGALDEIVKLLTYHNEGTLKYYALSAVTVASIYRKQFDVFNTYPLLFTETSNELLILKNLMNEKIEPKEIMSISSDVGFKNKRYLKLHPERFEKELERQLIKYEFAHGSILHCVPFSELENEGYPVFGNLSIPSTIRTNIPQLLRNQRFKKEIVQLLENTHNEIKKQLQEDRK